MAFTQDPGPQNEERVPGNPSGDLVVMKHKSGVKDKRR